MRIIKACLLSLSALMIVAAVPPSARANWLDLTDGNYDVTLSCTFSSVITCPTDIHGTMTISGAGATAFDFTINGQNFVGDPTDGIATDGLTFDNQFSTLDLSPFSFLGLANDLSIPNPFGLPDHHWTYCNNSAPNLCTPDTDGGWTATRVPEPASMAIFGVGLAGLAFGRRRRVR